MISSRRCSRPTQTEVPTGRRALEDLLRRLLANGACVTVTVLLVVCRWRRHLRLRARSRDILLAKVRQHGELRAIDGSVKAEEVVTLCCREWRRRRALMMRQRRRA
jgi:hypothetical protein